MSISIEGIETADNLWFGQNGVARDRDAAVALFRSLAHSGGAASEGSGYSSGNDDAEPCKSGMCCNHRRNANNDNGVNIAEASNMSSQKSVLCVGAGPSGLVTVRELRSHGIANVKCYEGSDNIGGAFANAYDDATMTSSNLLTAFSSYPLSEYYEEMHGTKRKDGTNNGVDNKAEMWTCKEYCQYLHAFARRFGLHQYIFTKMKVLHIRFVGSQWEVHSVQTNDNSRRIERFDAVCICSGLHQYPNIPDWCKEDLPPSEMENKPQIIHSSQFVSGKDLKDKNVVIVGLGESGSDISLLAAKHAKSVKISVRQGSGSGYVLPRYTCGEEVGDLNTSRGFGRSNVWGPAELRSFSSLVKTAAKRGCAADMKELARCFLGSETLSPLDLMAIEWNDRYRNLPYNRFGTKNYAFLEAIHSYGVTLCDSISSRDDLPSDCDIVILCTGFNQSFDFFDDHSHPDINLRQRSPIHRSRYQHMIDLDIGPSLAFIGYARPAFGAIPPLSEMSARYWSLLLTGERTIPHSARAEVEADRSYEERLFFRDASRIQSLVQYHRTMDNLARLIGCLPPFEELTTNHPNVYSRVMHSCLSGVQYRLLGDGWTNTAWTDQMRHPLPNHSRQPKSAFRVKADAGIFSSDT